jgi:deazaflavin-dependent oxidoreductase (nitroreductase family)
MTDWNAHVIEEFRANGGKVTGDMEGWPIVLVHHTGAKTGTERVNPLVYQQLDGDAIAVFASKAGAPTNPDWYHNLVAHPDTTIEIGTETRHVRARVAPGDERERIWERQKQAMPQFSKYEETANREIPVVIFETAS